MPWSRLSTGRARELYTTRSNVIGQAHNIIAAMYALFPRGAAGCQITGVEVTAALFRRIRAGSLSVPDATRALGALRTDLALICRVVELTPTIADRAMNVAAQHGLRGYDCVQLAAALFTQSLRATAGLSPLILVSADADLNAAALTEGLDFEDPNNYR